MKIACDPVTRPAGNVQENFGIKSQRLNEPQPHETDYTDIDLWLVTHSLEDHLEIEGLERIKPFSRVIAPKNTAKQLKSTHDNVVDILRWGETKSLMVKGCQIAVEALPTIQGMTPESAYFDGGVNGYWVMLSQNNDRFSFCVTGDEELNRKPSKVLQSKHLDLLIPNLGVEKQGRQLSSLTLSANRLKTIKHRIQPVYTLSDHFGTFEHYVEPISIVQQWAHDSVAILEPVSIYKSLLPDRSRTEKAS